MSVLIVPMAVVRVPNATKSLKKPVNLPLNPISPSVAKFAGVLSVFNDSKGGIGIPSNSRFTVVNLLMVKSMKVRSMSGKPVRSIRPYKRVASSYPNARSRTFRFATGPRNRPATATCLLMYRNSGANKARSAKSTCESSNTPRMVTFSVKALKSRHSSNVNCKSPFSRVPGV